MNTKSDTTDQDDEADEDLGEAFFANAVLTRSGESVVAVVGKQPQMRVVGRRIETPITFHASADLLKKGMRFNDEIHRTFAGRDSGVPKGVYRFLSHDLANAHQVECVAMKMARLSKEARHG